MSIIAGTAIESALGNYQIERSLRFNSADSAYLNRTFSTPTTQNVFTFSAWLKRGKISAQTCLFGESASTSNGIYFDAADTLSLYFGSSIVLTTAAVFRDPSAWYHIVWTSNGSTQTIYVNGVSRASGTASQTRINSAIATYLMSQTSGSIPTDGYLTEVHFIDGSALDPTSFGEYNSDTGVWQPKAYTGSYGTNGFYVNFSDNSNTTAATLGKDYSGNGNNWTPNNFSVTAGTGNDSLVDTPTPYGTDTGVGGEVRGNYCTFNSNLYNAGSVTYTNGNLLMTMTANADRFNLGTIAVPSGKWYWEFTPNGFGNSSDVTFGICKASRVANGPWVAYGGPDTINFNTGNGWSVYGSNVGGATGSIAGNDVIGIALDMDSNYIYIYKNGTLLTSRSGSITTSVPHTLFIDTYASGSTAYLNTGQRPFAYTAPSGYKAICTTNLPDPTIADGGKYFNAVLYTGTGSNGLAVTGTGFQPDWVWIKSRSNAVGNPVFDVLRGVGTRLETQATSADTYNADSLTSFDADGFTVNAGSSRWNASGYTYVAWNWKANGSGVSNTAGTIASTVSANTTSGFSVVTYTGTASSGGSVGHGLGVTPAFIIAKARGTTGGWVCWHQSLSGGSGAYIYLDLSSGAGITTDYWNGDGNGINSSTFGIRPSAGDNNYATTMLAYVFAQVPGYSAFGSFSTNGSSDGPFIYTGFTPRWILMKYSNTTSYWLVMDTARNTYNVTNAGLRPNTTDAESTALFAIDIVSNGFKPRDGGGLNGAGNTTIYAAFAENPFKYALAR